jgi:hypothetical protein
MNREQRRKAEKDNKEEVKMQTSKLKEVPTKVLVGCVGSDDDGCGENVFIEYESLGDPEALFDALQEIGWFLGVTEVSIEGEPAEVVHSILCPDCAEDVLETPSEGIEDIVEPGSTKDVVSEG